MVLLHVKFPAAVKTVLKKFKRNFEIGQLTFPIKGGAMFFLENPESDDHHSLTTPNQAVNGTG